MQKENEKVSGIMADDDTTNSNIDNLIEKLKFEVIADSRGSTQLSSQMTVQSTSNKLLKEEDQDIDSEITELENLIKKLQAEIVEMTQSANKPLPVSFCPLITSQEGSCCNNGTCQASPEILNEIKEPECDAGFSEVANDDGLLEEVKMFAESLSNLMNSSNITNEQKEALNDVKWNFSAMWDNATKSSHNNLEIAEKTIEDISCKLAKAFDCCIVHSSLETDKPITEHTTPIESTIEPSIESSSDKAEINRCDEVSEFFGPNDKDTINDTCDDDKKTSSDIEQLGNSNGYNDFSEITIETGTDDNTLSNFPIILNTETPYNFPDTDSHVNGVNIEAETVSEKSSRDLPEPDTVDALKATILKPSENLFSSKTSTPELSQVIPLPTHSDIPETQTQSVTRDAIPKADSILKCINRKIRKIVGRDSEKSMSKDRYNNEMDKNLSKEFLKAFPRCKSEPKKCDDSYLINPTNKVVVLTQGSLNNVNKFPVPMNTNKSKTSNPETNNIKTTESSNGARKNAKQTIPAFVSNGEKRNYTDKPVTGYPLVSAPTNVSLPKADSQNKNYVQAHLTTTGNRLKSINTPNGPQLVNTDNIIDNPDITKRNLEQDLEDLASLSSGTGSIIPKLFNSNLNTEAQQENIMKAEVKSGQGKKEEELSAVETEQDDEEGEYEDEDDDTSTYDVD